NERESAVAPKVLCVRSNLSRFCWLCCIYHRNLCCSFFCFVISLVFRGCFFVDARRLVLGEIGCDVRVACDRCEERADPERKGGVQRSHSYAETSNRVNGLAFYFHGSGQRLRKGFWIIAYY